MSEENSKSANRSEAMRAAESGKHSEQTRTPAPGSKIDSEANERASREIWRAGGPGSRIGEIKKQAEIIEEWFEDGEFILVSELLELLEMGATCRQALDYLVVEKTDTTQSRWAEKRGVTRQTVNGGVQQVKELIEDNE